VHPGIGDIGTEAMSRYLFIAPHDSAANNEVTSRHCFEA